MITPLKDVIAAVATPPGRGAIGVIRLSGEGAVELADRVFRGAGPLASAAGYTVHHGRIMEEGVEVDEVLVTVFRGPRSYTGEDAVEISCHGGSETTGGVLSAVVGAGARPAGPGEFTRRAFLNGKMDLTQAEAVADLIGAQTGRARALSVAQLEGKLGARVRELRERLVSLCALLELALDFSEEGVELLGPEETKKRIGEVLLLLGSMVRSYAFGSVARDGVSVVLAGRPNAGKSSLFNLLLQEERSIVTPIPGTTRDTIEEAVLLGGILFRLTDTAGIRGAADIVEAHGVERAVASVRAAEVILLVEDLSAGVEEGEIASVMRDLLGNQRLVVALNKCDLAKGDGAGLPVYAGEGGRVVRTSAKTGEGLDELKRALVESVIATPADFPDGVVVTQRRHVDALQRAIRFLQGAEESSGAGRTNEFIALDVREAADALGEITGEVTTDEILDGIFSRFCIGK